MFTIDASTSSSDLLNLLLKNRQVKLADVNSFTHPPSPRQIDSKEFAINQNNLDKAKDRINTAIKNKENILIYGDYDVDGITSTAILWNVLNQKGAKVLPFVPDRHLDGYGVKAKSFFKFESKKKIKFDLLITVDNGIVAKKELDRIIKKGTDVIVVDHHVAGDKLPSSIIKIHSTKVAGAALSWLLAKEISKDADLGLAALGTVTDCLPLIGINRSLVYHGLRSLRSKPSPGIEKLIQISSANQELLSSTDLGFVLGPRINAVGRLSDPTDALRLLCSSSLNQASKFAKILDQHNRQRQSLQQKSIRLAKEQVDPKSSDKLLFIADKSFHPGIIGLVAGRLTEQHYLPSIIIAIDGPIAKGSCRSIKELDIVQSLRQLSDLFVDLGGHPGAAGFTIETKNIPQFKKKITKIINKELAKKELKPSTFIDAQMKLSAVTVENCKLIEKLQPYGMGNPEPLFLIKDVRVTDKRLLGSKKEHLKLKVDDPQTPIKENVITRFNNSFTIDIIAFRQGDSAKDLKVGDLITITARLNLNVWNGFTTPQLIVKEILS